MYYKNPIELNQSVLGSHDCYLITFNTIIFVSIVDVNSHFLFCSRENEHFFTIPITNQLSRVCLT